MNSKFAYNDKIKVTAGFYKDSTGQIKSSSKVCIPFFWFTEYIVELYTHDGERIGHEYVNVADLELDFDR